MVILNFLGNCQTFPQWLHDLTLSPAMLKGPDFLPWHSYHSLHCQCPRILDNQPPGPVSSVPPGLTGFPTSLNPTHLLTCPLSSLPHLPAIDGFNHLRLCSHSCWRPPTREQGPAFRAYQLPLVANCKSPGSPSSCLLTLAGPSTP